MSAYIPPPARIEVRNDVATFNPVHTGERLAHLEADIVLWRKLKEWGKLDDAVAEKIAEQAAFVANWGSRVRPNHRPESNAEAGYLSVAEAEIEWGFSQQDVSRWRTSLKNREAYHARIALGAYRAAGLEAAENHRAEGTGENEWFTPPEYIEAAREVMGGIDLDPATHSAAQLTVQASQYYTKADDGLSLSWHGRVWLNPPYAQPWIARFVEKLTDEFSEGGVEQAVLLTHNYTDTTWFHRAEASADLLCFTRGRIRFVDLDGSLCAPTQGQAFFYFGSEAEKFRDIFSKFGFVR
ncbi:MAG TPA: DNA N-6-adenine-methyltransferase [Acetobacteraceae bacterium]|jgi:ParB family chromosome partitioning protein